MSSTRNNQAKTEDKINMSGIWLKNLALFHSHGLHILSMRRYWAISHDAVLGSSDWTPALHRLTEWHAVRTFQPKTFEERLTCSHFFWVSIHCTFFSHTQTPKPLQRAFAFFEILSFLEDTNCISSTDLTFGCFLECFVVLPIQQFPTRGFVNSQNKRHDGEDAYWTCWIIVDSLLHGSRLLMYWEDLA